MLIKPIMNINYIHFRMSRNSTSEFYFRLLWSFLHVDLFGGGGGVAVAPLVRETTHVTSLASPGVPCLPGVADLRRTTMTFFLACLTTVNCLKGSESRTDSPFHKKECN